MTARASQHLPPPSRGTSAPPVASTDPGTMAPAARTAELAQLLARGALRATYAPTARPVAESAASPPEAAPARSRIGLAPAREDEPACGHARAPGATGARIATEDHREDDK
jgi:hypothetical protein